MKYAVIRNSRKSVTTIIGFVLRLFAIAFLALQLVGTAAAAPLLQNGADGQPEALVPSIITIQSGSTTVGDPVNVAITIDVPVPNLLAAATIQFQFDPAIISFDSCTTNPIFTLNICNLSNPGVVTYSAISVLGINGAFALGSINFTGLTEGTSNLTIVPQTFEDGSGEAPLLNNGTIDVAAPTAVILGQASASGASAPQSGLVLILLVLAIGVLSLSYSRFRGRTNRS